MFRVLCGRRSHLEQALLGPATGRAQGPPGLVAALDGTAWTWTGQSSLTLGCQLPEGLQARAPCPPPQVASAPRPGRSAPSLTPQLRPRLHPPKSTPRTQCPREGWRVPASPAVALRWVVCHPGALQVAEAGARACPQLPAAPPFPCFPPHCPCSAASGRAGSSPVAL